MSARTVAIELTSESLDVVAIRFGSPVGGVRIPLQDAAEAEAWLSRVRGLIPELRSALKELKAEGAAAHVLYRSPTSAGDLSSFPLRSNQQVRNAAVLGCRASLPYAMNEAVAQAFVLGKNKKGSPPLRHAVVAADRDEVCQALVQLVTGAGLEVVTIAPIDAALFAHVASRVTSSSDAQQAVLYLGRTAAILGVGGAGDLDFARQIGLGFDPLADSLTRPILARVGGEPLVLTLDEARRILFNHGIPSVDDQIEGREDLTGAQLRPLIQPSLQRSCIEIKQSLRIALKSYDRSKVRLKLTGPAAGLSGLRELLEAELDLPVEVDEAYTAFDYSKPDSPGSELLDGYRQKRSNAGLNLLPFEMQNEQYRLTIRRFMWAGTLLAVALVGFDAAHFDWKVRVAKEELARVEQEQEQEEILDHLGQQLVTARTSISNVETMVEEHLGDTIDISGTLKELTYSTPENVRFTRVSIQLSDDRRAVVVSGFALASPDGDDPSSALTRYLKSVTSSPLFESVSMHNAQSGILGEEDSQRFDLSFKPVLIPPGLEKRVAVDEGGEP